MSAIDNMFIATNFEEEDNDDNPDRALCRYEFMEIIVRIADYKYKKKFKANSLADAVHMLIKDNIFKNFTPAPWQSWREQLLWNYDVSDVFEANAENLKKLYKKVTGVKGPGGEVAKRKTIDMVTSPIIQKLLLFDYSMHICHLINFLL